MNTARARNDRPTRKPRFSEDTLLGGRVILRQPARGERAAIDPVLLAAAVPARKGERALDVGSGTGAAALCLARRVAGCRVVGLEKNESLAALADENVSANRLAWRVRIVPGDVLAPPASLKPGTYHHVIVNPPYLGAGRARASPLAGRQEARIEGSAGLADWVRLSLAMLRRGGCLSVIHRADRLNELLGCLAEGAGDIVIFPLWPKKNRPAKRVIVQARKGVGTPLRLVPGLVLHQADGGYTAEARAVLWDGAALEIRMGARRQLRNGS